MTSVPLEDHVGLLETLEILADQDRAWAAPERRAEGVPGRGPAMPLSTIQADVLRLIAENPLVARLPPDEVGCLYVDAAGRPAAPDPASDDFRLLLRHRGCVRGAWPTVSPYRHP